MRILFITNGSIGDVVMSTGLLGYLLDTYPSATFTVATSPLAAPLFEAFPRLERVLVIRKQSWNRHWLRLWQELWYTRFYLVVDLRGSALSFFLRAKQRKIFHSNDKSKPKIEQLAALFALHPPPLPRLWLTEEATRKAKALLPSAPVIVMIPKSNSPFKDWPVERFAELGNRLLKKPVFSASVIVVLGLTHQKAALAPLTEALPASRVLDLSGQTDMPTACAILKQAQLVISNDSGLLHMAGALQAPLVGLYGPTNDVEYAPRGPHVSIAKVREFAPGEKEIQDPTLIQKLTVDQAEEAIRKLGSGLIN
jgi:lipopolysaccharide export system permease protein